MNKQSEEKFLSICMLGGFTLSSAMYSISDSENRSRKVWILLSYLIYSRTRVVPTEELIGLLWDGDRDADRSNALKAILHRARAFLDRLEDYSGQQLILRQADGYIWNPDIPCVLDVDQFVEACKKGQAATTREERMLYYLQAAELYKGHFLAKLSSEEWVLAPSAEYRQLYTQALHELLLMLDQDADHKRILALCERGLKIDPYDEELHYSRIKSLVALGELKSAVSQYEKAINLFFSEFGRRPSERLQSLYRQIARTSHAVEADLLLIKEQLRESSGSSGAFFCEYEFFKDIYRIQARSLSRSGMEVYLGLLTALDLCGEALPQQKLNLYMEKLRQLIRVSLRKGDVFSQYSPAQYIILLPCANYENSCKVMERIIKRFHRENPNSPTRLRYSVQPLEPVE